jgi:hypothetical protein
VELFLEVQITIIRSFHVLPAEVTLVHVPLLGAHVISGEAHFIPH